MSSLTFYTISALRTYGYGYVISIEHHDSFMSVAEGLNQAVRNLKRVNIEENAGDMWLVTGF
ncbi:sugar phosphate isomerase/epimerase [Virgibacillus natechei]|uniref:Sugar phosphate isomerase/epimerase n=1 Tax=Virgibacillus natechei TaxID=1216297 RepID=A0ABS4IGI6_9BACI|nr:sugar phosphate isomerase/epimerase [Virgibacillus natechei]